jgi:hypothetical protein
MRPDALGDDPELAWIVSGPASALARLEPLIEAHRARRRVHVLTSGPAGIETHLNRAAAVLMVGGSRTPARALPGVFLRAPNGDIVPAGWIPDAGARLSLFARAAAEVLSRLDTGRRGPAVLLSELDDRALALAAELAARLPEDLTPVQWTSERLSRVGLIEGLRCGPGFALYLGHGVAGGWLGYGGFGREALQQAAGRPMGMLLSVSCSMASRPRRGLSFCEEAVLAGVCGAALGACGRTLHRSNALLVWQWAQILARAEVTTLAKLLAASSGVEGALDRYRIVGDPLTPLVGASGSDAAVRAVFAPGPDGPLPVVPLCGWALQQ